MFVVFGKNISFSWVYLVRKYWLSYRIAGPFQFLLKGAFLLYMNFRKLLLIYFCCWYKVSLPHIYDYLERRKRRGLPILFSIHVHLLVCYMLVKVLSIGFEPLTLGVLSVQNPI